MGSVRLDDFSDSVSHFDENRENSFDEHDEDFN